MNFDLSEDQALLRDAVARLVARDYGFEQRRRHAAQPDGWSRALWQQAADIGLFALLYPVEHGGLGGGPVEAMVAWQALGRALPVEPLLPAMVLGAAALRHATPAMQARWVPRIAAGDCVLAWGQGGDCRAHAQAEGWCLEGELPAVLHGDSADTLLLASSDGGLFLVGTAAPRLERRGMRSHDGRRVAKLRLRGVAVQHADTIAAPGEGAAAIEAVAQAGIAAQAAEAVGLMEWLLETTVEYLKTRHQFGGPIGRFQALQHRAAEMLVALELSRGMAMLAAALLDEPDAAARAAGLAAVKLQLGGAARFVAEQAVQLHGGIGVTEENAVGHGLKRVVVMAAEFGGFDEHLTRLVRAGGLAGALA